MKKILLILFALISSLCHAIDWHDSFENAKNEALATNKLILIDFTAVWCRPCRQMDNNVWSHKEIEAIMQNLVPLKINIDANRDLAMKYGVSGIPNIFIVDANGKVIHSFSGYKDKRLLKIEIEKFTISTKFFKNEMANFKKNNNSASSLELAEKQLEFSLTVDSEVKSYFLKLAMNYIDFAEKKMDKKASDFNEKMQRIELIRVERLLYEKNYSKAEKKISKSFQEKNIFESNKGIYLTTLYIVASGLKKDSQVESESKLKSLEGGEALFQKALLILNNS